MACERLWKPGGVGMGIALLVTGSLYGQCERDWIGGEPYPGMNGAVGASVVWDPDGAGPRPAVLVVAGDFTIAGAAAAARLAAWDGSAWTSDFGAGLDGPVRALCVLDGALVAAGEFTHAGGVAASRVACWNGVAWSPLGDGVDNSAYALTVHDGRLVIGGTFAHAGDAAAMSIAAWDGQAWSAIGTSGLDGPVYALGELNGVLYAGGEFDHADNAIAANIAAWNGAAWTGLGDGVVIASAYGPAQVRSLLTDGGVLYVGGAFDHAGSLAADGVARWDGAAWSAAGQGLYHRTCVRYHCTTYPYRALALARSGSLIYAAATAPLGDIPLMFEFNGASWSSAGTLDAMGAAPWPLTTLASYNGVVYVGGAFGGPLAPQNFARLRATSWSLLSGINGAVRALTGFGGGLVAVGDFTQIDGVDLANVASWDGVAWHALGAGIGVNASDVATDGTNLYVGAWPGGILQWDGSTWRTLYGAGGFGGAPSVCVWNNEVIAGARYAGFGIGVSAVAAWDGSAWSPMGEAASVADGHSPFATLAGQLYVAGTDNEASAPVLRWNGFEWIGVGSNALGPARAIVVHEGSLYATLGHSPGPGVVARLSGSTWQPVGGEFDAVPGTLASVDGELFAAGDFTLVGGASCNHVARWDGTAWTPLGTGADAPVLAVAGFTGNVVVGGEFGEAGGRGYSSFAIYGCAPAPACACDFNADGALGSQDFFDFLGAFLGGAAGADFNHDGVVTSQDFFDFLGCFLSVPSGC